MSVTITIGGVDRTTVIPFDGAGRGTLTVTETAPGSATANLTIVDVDNSITVNLLDPVVITDVTNGMNLFQGYVQQTTGTVQGPYRIIECELVDLNAILDTTLVGVPDGTSWTGDPATAYYTVIDPNASVTGGTDAEAVQALFAAYWNYPVSIDTTSAVETLNPSMGNPPLRWDRVTLRTALEDIAALSSDQTYFWIDPDAKLHWTNRPQAGAPTAGPGIAGNVKLGFPQAPTTVISSPYALTDDPASTTELGYENFSYVQDGKGFAYSLYLNGATGYTYTPPIPPPVTPGAYILTFLRPTLIYRRLSDGSIYLPGTVYGTPGQQVYVDGFYERVGAVRGRYWMIQSGTPHVIPRWWLVKQGDPNITIAKVRTTTIPGEIGIGGSGWVGSASWLSRYMDAPDSQTQIQRDAIGGSALRQMNVPVIRGSCEVTWNGILFRAGMGLTITNAPHGINAQTFTLLRVTTTWLSGLDERHAVLEWGNAPLGSLGLRRQAARKAQLARGATVHLLKVNNVNPKAGGSVVVQAQLVNDSGQAWAVEGKPVDFTVVVKNKAGSDVTATTAYTLNPESTVTDSRGAASTTLTTDTVLGLTYTVIASSPD